MPGFADLAPLTTPVVVRGGTFQVGALTLAQLAALAFRFSGLRAIFQGGDMLTTMLEEGDDCVAAIIAASTNDNEAAVRGARLTAAEQAAIVTACISLTMPDSEEELGNLVAQVAALLSRVATFGAS